MLRTAAPKVMWVDRARTLAFCLLALMVAVSMGMLVGAKPAHAANFTVGSMGDVGDTNPGDGTCASIFHQVGTDPECTLRAAIEEANANGQHDTISFYPALSGTITLTLGQPTIANDPPADDLLIQGPGASKITVSGNDADRVFLNSSGAGATISGLTISDGFDTAGSGISNLGTLKVSSSTVSNNTVSAPPNFVPYGGGILNLGTVTLANTIVARNTANTSPDVGGKTFTSQGYNLIGNTSGSSGWVTSDLKNRNPLLGPLQDNGGPTFTHALLPGSPALGAIPVARRPQ